MRALRLRWRIRGTCGYCGARVSTVARLVGCRICDRCLVDPDRKTADGPEWLPGPSWGGRSPTSSPASIGLTSPR